MIQQHEQFGANPYASAHRGWRWDEEVGSVHTLDDASFFCGYNWVLRPRRSRVEIYGSKRLLTFVVPKKQSRMEWLAALVEGGSIITLTYLGATRVVPNYNVMGVAKAAPDRWRETRLYPPAVASGARPGLC